MELDALKRDYDEVRELYWNIFDVRHFEDSPFDDRRTWFKYKFRATLLVSDLTALPCVDEEPLGAYILGEAIRAGLTFEEMLSSLF